jgi:DNA repair exonuclease SbcCD ATPase subunit
MNVLLKQKISDNTNTIWKSEENKKLIDEKIKLVKSHLAELQKNNEILIKEKNERLDKAVKQIEELKIQSDALKTKIESIELTIEDEISISKKINKLGQLRHQIEANLKIINNDVSFFQKHDNCPTCKQIIDNAFKETTVNQKQTQIHEIQNGLHKLIDEHTKTNNRLNEIIEIRSNINSLKIEMGETKTKIVSLMNYKEEIEYEISNIKKKVTSVESTKIEDLEIELAKNQDMLSDLNIQQQLYNTAQQLLKDGGIKTKIVKQFIPIINTLVNKYLSSMDFMVDFRLDENFEETIKSRFRDVFTYSSFSEGEKMKIDLSLLFTWRAVAKLRNSMSTNLLIMDEVFDSSLDSNSVDSLVNLIFQNSPDTNIFIISHKEQMTDKFHNILKFNKNKNFSQITS